MTQPDQRPVSAQELADRLGVSLCTVYKRHERWRLLDGMPATIRKGRLSWERSGMMAWLTRHHPARAAQAPANDAAPPPAAVTVEEHRTLLAAAYGPARAASGATAP
ncbi:hypothetical protein IP86_03120 [Rhodopseudomonas sp. AAP120]|uniref:HTH domain-containing protein n=1 Tax=Rhodopseudomonas sp. AAP120 TaxID=1523430 RepID=UPI0006B8BFED|nr:HTH domain-containing protein [Rhodopseudomonas sp. AAP120]KPG01814.1 hypothetical protein IP86_03120 [Rhodopseudomonas sp. AAP120]